MRIVVAITGASGSIYASKLIELLSKFNKQVESISIIATDNSRDIWLSEIGEILSFSDNLNITEYNNRDFSAPFASGSAKFDAMVVIPCSMGVLGRIASGISNDLITRAADVFLKERRKLIIVPRETPLNRIHLTNMLALNDAGAIICPASPSFYRDGNDIDSIIESVVDRVIDLIGLDYKTSRWGDK